MARKVDKTVYSWRIVVFSEDNELEHVESLSGTKRQIEERLKDYVNRRVVLEGPFPR